MKKQRPVWVPESTSLSDRTVSYGGRIVTQRTARQTRHSDRQDTQTDTDLPDGVTFVSADRGQEKQHLPAVRHTALTAAMQLARLTARGAGTGTCGWPLDWLDWHPQGCLPQSVKWRHSNPSRSSNFSLLATGYRGNEARCHQMCPKQKGHLSQ